MIGYVERMVLATCNKAKRLIFINYVDPVRPSDLERSQDDLKKLLAELSPNFRLLINLTGLESMHPDCVGAVGELMKLIDQASVGMVVRVIPDPKKDIGLNILTIFHYRKHPRVVTCQTMMEAAKVLSL